MKILYQFIFWLLTCFLLLGISSVSYADQGRLPNQWKSPIEQVDGFQNPVQGDSVQMIQSLVLKNFIPIARYIFIGVALIMFGMYAYYMVLGGTGDEEQLTEQRKNFLFAAIGFTLIGIASQVVEVFDPFRDNEQNTILSLDNARSVTQIIINYSEILLGAIAIAVIFYAAIQMITSNGDEEKSTEGKNLLKYGLIGFVIVMLADPLINLVFFPNDGQSPVGDQQAEEFIKQGLGVLKFVLTFLGVIVFVSFIIAAILFFTALDDDDRMERAKRALIWTAIGLVVIILSYGIAVFFIGQGG